MNQIYLNKLVAFQLWCYRIVLRTTWMERLSSVKMIRRIGNEPEIQMTIKTRQLEYLGRGQKYAVLQLVIQDKIRAKLHKNILAKEPEGVVWMQERLGTRAAVDKIRKDRTWN